MKTDVHFVQITKFSLVLNFTKLKFIIKRVEFMVSIAVCKIDIGNKPLFNNYNAKYGYILH